MARQLGHVKYKGTIGEIRHFKIKGMTGNFANLVLRLFVLVRT